MNEEDWSAIAAEFKECIEENFDSIHWGRPEAHSEYGVAYKTYGMAVIPPEMGFGGSVDDNFIRGAFQGVIEANVEDLKKQGDVLVWRTSPQLTVSIDPETSAERIRLYFRAHAVATETYERTLPPRIGVSALVGNSGDMAWALAMVKMGKGVRPVERPLGWFWRLVEE